MRFEPSFLEEIRSRLPISQVAGRYVKLKKAGAEWTGLSPFNAEKTPSFYVNDRKGAFFDFSANQNGDVFNLLMDIGGLSFPQAVEQCASDAGLAMPAGWGNAARPDPLSDQKRQEREEAWRRSQALKIEAEERNRKSIRGLAYDIWNESKPTAGTVAERYFLGRGIPFAVEFASLRFHKELDHRDAGSGDVTVWPAVVAAVRAPVGQHQFLGIWRIYLRHDGSGKAPVRNPKMGLGSYAVRGGSVWLGNPTASANVCEGIETGCGIAGILGRSQGVQCALGTSGLVNFIPPENCFRTLIWPDGDTDRIRYDKTKDREIWSEAPGPRAAMALMTRLISEGRPASIQPYPRNGKDFLEVYVHANQR